jgi:cytosine/adenosine deaminase-related metal-dependent hydrolase
MATVNKPVGGGERVRSRCLIRARWVLPMAGPPLEGGWLRITHGRIMALGRRVAAGRGPECRDLTDCLIVPGLVNSHTHLEFSDCLEPLSAAGGLPAWIGRVIAMRRRRANDSDAQVDQAVAHGLAESIAAGTTCLGEIATAVRPSYLHCQGPRLRVFREVLGLSLSAAARASAASRSDLARLARSGVAVGLSPHAPYSTAARLAAELRPPGGRDPASRGGMPSAMHLAESREEMEFIRDGRGPFRELFAMLGLLPEGMPPPLLPPAEWISRLARRPRGIVVHGTFLPEDPPALARLARHRDRLAVVVCPRTALALSGRLPPLAAFREAGVRVAIGTDSRASTPDLSVLAEGRVLVDAGVADPAEVLGMVTVQGGWALGFAHAVGTLSPGRCADLVIMRPRMPIATASQAMAAVFDPATEIVATLRRGRLVAGGLPCPDHFSIDPNR